MDKFILKDQHGLLEDGRWWTNEFLDKAYDEVKDRKFPILIPSYNNPSPPAVRGFLSKMDDEYNYPIIIFVRESQYDSYVNANEHKFVTVVPFKDELINSAGNARKWSLKWLYQNGYEHAFSFDDDALGIGMTEHALTGKGDPKSGAIKDTNISKVLACWQYSMELACKKYDVGISGVYPCGYGWKAEYCWIDESILLYRGNINQVVCLSVKKLLENGITYNDNKACGHEDIDLIFQCLEKKIPVCTFPFINYSTPPMDCANFSMFGSTMTERFKAQQKLMIDKYGIDYPYAYFRNKKGLDQVVINFRRYRKDNNIEKYALNLFEDLSGSQNTTL